MSNVDTGKLANSINDQIEIMSHMQVGSDEQIQAAKSLETQTKVYNSILETRVKFDSEMDDMSNKNIILADNRIKADREYKLAIADRVINCTKTAVCVVGIGLLAAAGFSFEQEGAFTNSTFKRGLDLAWKFFPKL